MLNCVPSVKDIGNVASADLPWNAFALRYREEGPRSQHPEPESRRTESLSACWARMSREKLTFGNVRSEPDAALKTPARARRRSFASRSLRIHSRS